jgi:L-seryl-tRNA(Ser) seleniumtransferase
MDVTYPTYESIGVRPLINCRGTYTIISGSLSLPEVKAAMAAASSRYVHLDELMEKVGERIAEVMQCEFGLVTNGCAAAICQVTSACMAGDDPEAIKQLPDTTGLKDEVVLQKKHQHVYNHAIRMTGANIIEVETLEEMEAAVCDQTAMLAVFGDAADRGEVSVAEMVTIGKREGVPVFVDAAAERPDVPNRYLEEGADAVAYSGGKCLRGPQSSGLVLGRRDLLWTAFMHGAPHHGIGRPMKAGKEEVMGLLAAVEKWVERDHDAEWKMWEGWLDEIWNAVSHVPSVTREIQMPGRSNVAPILKIGWDASRVELDPEQARQALSDGDPRIEVFTHETGVEFMAYMMEESEATLVAKRLHEVLQSGK